MAIRNEFQSTLFRSRRDMIAAIAEQFLTAGGQNSADDVKGFLSASTDAELATECIDGWGLNAPSIEVYDDEGEGKMVSHMEYNEYSAEDLAAAIATLR